MGAPPSSAMDLSIYGGKRKIIIKDHDFRKKKRTQNCEQ